MGTYVYLYIGGDQPETPEDGAAVMQQWVAWFDGLGAAVVDGGNPFGPSARLEPDGSTAAAASAGATGYSIVRAADLAAAVEMARGCPHLAANGAVEVYETFDVMG